MVGHFKMNCITNTANSNHITRNGKQIFHIISSMLLHASLTLSGGQILNQHPSGETCFCKPVFICQKVLSFLRGITKTNNLGRVNHFVMLTYMNQGFVVVEQGFEQGFGVKIGKSLLKFFQKHIHAGMHKINFLLLILQFGDYKSFIGHPPRKQVK